MRIIVEDGTGVVGANSYSSLEYADNYFSTHEFHSDEWEDTDILTRQSLLVSGTRSLDLMFDWEGFPLYLEQNLGFPRQRIWSSSYRVWLNPLIIPSRLKDATCEMAMYLKKGDPFKPAESEGLESLKIDVIELKFSNSSSKTPVPQAVLPLLRGLGEYIYGKRSGKVLVG